MHIKSIPVTCLLALFKIVLTANIQNSFQLTNEVFHIEIKIRVTIHMGKTYLIRLDFKRLKLEMRLKNRVC